MRSGYVATFAILTMIVCGLQVDAVRRVEPTISSRIGLNAHETHAGASLLGQFRTSFSTWLWLKTDLYLHNGVEMRVLTERELEGGSRAIRDGDGWHQAIGDEQSMTTVVPDAASDFRGVLGDVERAVQAYKPMEGHIHNDPRSALPLFRLMTLVDPQFIPGWTTGAMVLASDRNQSSTSAALAYLRSGLEENPGSVAIRTELARLMISRNRDLRGAIPILREGVHLATKNYADFSEDEQEACVDCFRWLSLCLAETGGTTESIQNAQLGLDTVGDDAVLKRLANPEPIIFIGKESPKESTKPSNGLPTPTEHRHDSQCGHAH